ncbi:MAG: AIR synthase related protein [Chloroflexi bacterium]|nr:AIR synthase related protein [Chloroflexota bacterium]
MELEMIAQTWSEHCVHKTFRAKIEYTGPDGKTETIDGILNTYLRAATEQINKPWVYSAFVDNAGIVRFDDSYDLAFKAETHNHPSALDPFGGANTGIGGVVRDILGVSARPIANTDVLCFGLPDMPHDDLPTNVLHPARIADGVIAGIEDYGNKMGIPTVNGSIHYHPGYTANPLVYCGCLGILPHGSHVTEPQAGDLIVAIGGRTGRDGLRGATFSSMEMDVATSEIAGTAVQIGHPIMEKQVQEVVLRARDEQLYHAITDCGAGGFSSAGRRNGGDSGWQSATASHHPQIPRSAPLGNLAQRSARTHGLGRAIRQLRPPG